MVFPPVRISDCLDYNIIEVVSRGATHHLNKQARQTGAPCQKPEGLNSK
jgi:hypothetical protein